MKIGTATSEPTPSSEKPQSALLDQIGLGLEWLGAILLCLYLVGTFKHQDRIVFYESLVATKEDVPSENPIARMLLSDFGITEKQLSEVGYVGLQWVAIGDSEPFGGYVLGRSVDKEKKKRLATLDEFREWAYSQSHTYGWVSFLLVISGLIIKSFSSRLSTFYARARKAV